MPIRALAIGVPLASVAVAGSVHAQSLEELVLARINAARADPAAYAASLRDYRRHFDGDIVYLPGDYNGVRTREGVAAVDEAIAFLEHLTPLRPLEPASLLTRTAAEFSREQGEAGSSGHLGQDGSRPGDRVKRSGGDVFVGEVIAYGFADADQVVRQLIVDDGVPDRGHRKLLFTPRFRFAGIGCGPHRAMEHLCVVDLSATPDGRAMRVRYAEKP